MTSDLPARTGRPRKTVPVELHPKVSAEAAAGSRQIDVAAICEMSADTFRRCLREDEALRCAWDYGRSLLHRELVSKLIEKAKQGETVPLLFALKVLFGYVEGQPLDGEARAPLVSIVLPAPLSADEYRARLVNAKQTLEITTRSRGGEEDES